MEVNIADLSWSTFIYPREGKNEKTVEALYGTLVLRQLVIVVNGVGPS